MATAAAISVTAGVAASAAKIGGDVKKKRAAERFAGQAEEAADRLLNAPEIAELDKNIREADVTIARERKVLEAIDPSLMEAGKQALQLLQGKESALLSPLRNQRTRDRKQLEERLRRQLGPGFETSSAGIEALGRFDEQTSDLLTRTQQGAALQLLGVSQRQGAISRQAEATALRTQQGAIGTKAELRTAAEKVRLGGQKSFAKAQGSVADSVGGLFEQVGSFAALGAGGAGFEDLAANVGEGLGISGDGKTPAEPEKFGPLY